MNNINPSFVPHFISEVPKEAAIAPFFSSSSEEIYYKMKIPEAEQFLKSPSETKPYLFRSHVIKEMFGFSYLKGESVEHLIFKRIDDHHFIETHTKKVYSSPEEIIDAYKHEFTYNQPLTQAEQEHLSQELLNQQLEQTSPARQLKSQMEMQKPEEFFNASQKSEVRNSYLGNITRKQAEDLLNERVENLQPGQSVFLFRDSSEKGAFVLSYIKDGTVEHDIYRPIGRNQFEDVGKGIVYTSADDIFKDLKDEKKLNIKAKGKQETLEDLKRHPAFHSEIVPGPDSLFMEAMVQQDLKKTVRPNSYAITLKGNQIDFYYRKEKRGIFHETAFVMNDGKIKQGDQVWEDIHSFIEQNQRKFQESTSQRLKSADLSSASDYYYPKMTHEECEELFHSRREGSFLVRNSKTFSDALVMAYKQNENFNEVLITYKSNGQIGNSDLGFHHSLKELIAANSDILKEPVTRG